MYSRQPLLPMPLERFFSSSIFTLRIAGVYPESTEYHLIFEKDAIHSRSYSGCRVPCHRILASSVPSGQNSIQAPVPLNEPSLLTFH